MAKIKVDPDLTHSSSRISCKDFREYIGSRVLQQKTTHGTLVESKVHGRRGKIPIDRTTERPWALQGLFSFASRTLPNCRPDLPNLSNRARHLQSLGGLETFAAMHD
jgi:hypothetical protein